MLAGAGTFYIADSDGSIQQTFWGLIATTISVAFFMAVNALVTG